VEGYLHLMSSKRDSEDSRAKLRSLEARVDQMDERLTRVEDDIRDLHSEMNRRFNDLRSERNRRFNQQARERRWLTGIILIWFTVFVVLVQYIG
jgi:molecular chaperone GrpE (heat shock protein)